MSAVMLADQRKFARGYIIRSSLLNESVVTLHACGRESCSGFPMWAPGARREWAPELRRPLRRKKALFWLRLGSATDRHPGCLAMLERRSRAPLLKVSPVVRPPPPPKMGHVAPLQNQAGGAAAVRAHRSPTQGRTRTLTAAAAVAAAAAAAAVAAATIAASPSP